MGRSRARKADRHQKHSTSKQTPPPDMAQPDIPRLDSEATKINLADLIPEVILCITDFLPKASVLCLGLCNKKLKELLFEKYRKLTHLEKKRIEDEDLGHSYRPTELRQFLHLLSRDIPNHVDCHYCFKLHDAKKGNLVGAPFPERQVFDCLKNADTPRYSPWGIEGYQITFSHVQQIMKRHREGPAHGISLQHLSGIYVTYNEDQSLQTFARFRPRIVSNRLFLCSQLWKLLPANRAHGRANLIRGFPCCAVQVSGQPRRDIHGQSIDLSLTDLARTTLWCPKCATNSNIQCYDFSGENSQWFGRAICFTRWVCLGDGLDPDSIEWRSLFGGKNGESYTNTGPWVRAAFEHIDEGTDKREMGRFSRCDNEPYSLKSLTCETYQLLKKELDSRASRPPPSSRTWTPSGRPIPLIIEKSSPIDELNDVGVDPNSKRARWRRRAHQTLCPWPKYEISMRDLEEWVTRIGTEFSENDKTSARIQRRDTMRAEMAFMKAILDWDSYFDYSSVVVEKRGVPRSIVEVGIPDESEDDYKQELRERRRRQQTLFPSNLVGLIPPALFDCIAASDIKIPYRIRTLYAAEGKRQTEIDLKGRKLGALLTE